MAADVNRVQEVFLKAVEADPDTRVAILAQECGTDEALRHRVEALLRAHDEPGSFLKSLDHSNEPVVHTVDYRPVSESIGTKIGPYVLREQIGEGGFGVVFVAEQTEPVRRKVALKVIKPGMDTREVIARFEAERQALALMDHPNIARVLDAGATDSGRPYFVMELVRGIPITEYCDKNQLSPKERLELFVSVCQAIQHAHQKGIIHRDIKPSNVLVTSHDGKPVAKVIDFGVAKAIGQQLTERTICTNFAQMIGTPLYMSPEQAEMSGLDIDTRSDIYSLGVLLYELLTGTTPLDNKRFAKAAYDEIRRMIREEEPPKPSTRLSTSDSIASIAVQRHMEPAKLMKLLRGELDWIVMKALEKDRNRRFETASAFATDVQRYLADEPVQACPPSALYRFRKFARRNRAGLATASVVALAVVLAVGSIGWVVRDRSARQAELNYRVEMAVEDATSARDRALIYMDNRFQWEATLAAALSALKRGEELAVQDPAALNPVVAKRLQELRAALDADERDHRFVVRLDEILQGVIVWDARRSKTKHKESFLKLEGAFKSYFGWDVGATPTAAVARFIQDRPKPTQEHLIAALDVCLACAPQDRPPARQWLGEILHAADADPWRKQARDALAAGDWPVLENLLKEVAVPQQRPALLQMLASYLPSEAGATKRELSRQILDTYPGEFWAHGRFAIALSHDVLAWLMANLTDPAFRDEKWALELAQEAVRLVPNDGDFWNTLGLAYYRVENWKQAVTALEKSIELSNGGRADDWFFLAMAHWRLGNKDAARRWYEQAVEWTPTHETRWYKEALSRFRAEATELLAVEKKQD